jgi:hypothetical protein
MLELTDSEKAAVREALMTCGLRLETPVTSSAA